MQGNILHKGRIEQERYPCGLFARQLEDYETPGPMVDQHPPMQSRWP